MRAVVLVLGLCVAVAYAETANYCYGDVSQRCGTIPVENANSNCSAVYGAANRVMSELSNYVNTHITRSFQYLLMSTHFASYEKNRPGFTKLYHTLSDENWNTAINLIKYMAKRGGKMDFNHRVTDNLAEPNEKATETYELYELASLARALDIQKSLAEEAIHIHNRVTKGGEHMHDPELSHYLEEKLMVKHAETIRNLAGHTNDLKSLLKAPQPSLSVFLFDEYLHKKLSA